MQQTSEPHTSVNSSITEFLDELKSQFTRTIDVKDSLDSKANNLITMAGAVATLFLGFGTFLIGQLQISDPIILGFALTFLMLEVVITIVGIWRAIGGYKLRDYYYPIVSEAFIHKEGEMKGKLNFDIINLFLNASQRELALHLIKTYMQYLRTNELANEEKAKLIEEAHWLYLIALIMIAPFALTIVIAILVSAVP
jgi:hypothetical protein